MQHRLLGNSGCSVSRLALGTMTFGAETDADGSFAQLDAFREAGGNLVDTADVYAGGESEAIIGRWLAARDAARDEIVLATKGRFATGKHPNDVGLSRRHLQAALDASLRRLGVETIDLYQLHAWDPLTPVEEYLQFAADAVRAGKVHYLGLSNFTGWQIAAVVERARAAGLTAPVTLQPQYNLLTRAIESEVVPACREYGLGMLPWSPLAGGWLTDKYSREEHPSGETRLGEDPDRGMEGYGRRSGDELTWSVIEVLEGMSEETGHTMAQLAIAWVADQPQVTAPILGARTPEQLAESLAVADIRLDDEQRRRLDEVSARQLPDYPYGELGIEQRSRAIEGER